MSAAVQAQTRVEDGYPLPPVRAGCGDWHRAMRGYIIRPEGVIVALWFAGVLVEGEEDFAAGCHYHLTLHRPYRPEGNEGGDILHERYMGMRGGYAVQCALILERGVYGASPDLDGIDFLSQQQEAG